MIRDVLKPDVFCPECGHTDAFFHCTRQDDHGTYDWGTLVTCLRCKVLFCLTTAAPDAADFAAIQRDMDEVNYRLVEEEDAGEILDWYEEE